MKKRTEADKMFMRKTAVYSENKFLCKQCGHKQLVPKFMEKNLCDWCGHWVFRDEKDEFKFRMSEKLRRE